MNREKKRPRSGQDDAAEKPEDSESVGASSDSNNTAAQLADYVRCMFQADDIIEVRRIWPDRAAGIKTRSTWHRAAALSAQAESLACDNAKGFGIYVGVNPRRAAGGRKAVDVACARNLVADFDGVSVETAMERWYQARLPAPTLVVATGHGCHVYLRLSAPVDLDTWERWQKDLISLLKSDPAIHDSPRVMRLPGFINTKVADARVPCEIVESDSAAIIELEGVPTLIPHVEATTRGDAGNYVGGDDWLEQAIAKVEAGDNRHDTGLWLACQLRDNKVPRVAADATLRAFQQRVESWESRPRFYPVDEALDAVEDAYSRPARKPASEYRRESNGSNQKAPPTDSVPDEGPGWYSVAEVGATPEYRCGLPAISTTYDALDSALGGGFRPRMTYPLAGRTGSAKSTLATNLARRMALAGESVLLLKLEEPLVEAVWRLHSAAASVPLRALLDADTDEYANELLDAWTLIRDLPIRLADVRDLTGIDSLCARHAAAGGRVVILDQFSMVEVAGVDSSFERAVMVSARLREIALRRNLAIIVVCQVNRPAAKNNKERLTCHDIRDAGTIENDAAGVILIDRARDDGGAQRGEKCLTLEVLVGKSRYGRITAPKDPPIELIWWPRTCRIESASRVAPGAVA